MEEQQKKLAGELVVVAIKAVIGKQDPFVTFRLGEVAKRTKTDYRGGQRPIWDDQVNLPVPEGKTKLYMQVFDEDGPREDLISEGEIDLTNVLKEGEEDNWYPLKYRGKRAGDIYIELTFYSAVSFIFILYIFFSLSNLLDLKRGSSISYFPHSYPKNTLLIYKYIACTTQKTTYTFV
ncbi:C2 domain-containing protein [Phascolomyces articulosus]|uniref:C2 domain-containing protein n=1 Tax=Phascolomyces articulosus TaxID=60185 RepID=A0AAD5K193_9FUNG|nr:C2 domain-containing protein [Phascolomyces articulosus]